MSAIIQTAIMNKIVVCLADTVEIADCANKVVLKTQYQE